MSDELREALVEARAKFGFIENAPAWGAPDKWEPTPFEVRQLARDAGAKIDKALATIRDTDEDAEELRQIANDHYLSLGEEACASLERIANRLRSTQSVERDPVSALYPSHDPFIGHVKISNADKVLPTPAEPDEPTVGEE